MNEIRVTARNIGAFFDLDGTLLPRPSLEQRFVLFLRTGRAVGLAAGLRWLARFVRELFGWRRGGFEERWLAATVGNKTHLAGIRTNRAEIFAATIKHKHLGFFSEALRRIAWHVAQDHAVYVVTGSLGPLAVCAAGQLCSRLWKLTGGKRPHIRVCATELEEVSGRWTGEVADEAMCGAAKARAIKRIAREDAIDLLRSYAYGDRWSDCWMLQSVGNPAAVNPSKALERCARRRAWTILLWYKEQEEFRGRANGEERAADDHDEPVTSPRTEVVLAGKAVRAG